MRKLTKEKGISLMGLMVGMAVAAIAVYAVQSVLVTFQAKTMEVREATDLERVRNILRTALSCEHTFSKITSACNNNEVAAYNNDDNLLINVKNRSNNYTKLGGYELLARCQQSTDTAKQQILRRISLEFRRVNRNENFRPLFQSFQICEKIIDI